MDKHLSEMMKRTLSRLKKYMPVYILIPVLTCGIAYWMALQSKPLYEAKAKISLANFEESTLSSPEKMKDYMMSEPFLARVKKLKEPAAAIQSRFQAVPEGLKTVNLSLKGSENAENELRAIVTQALKESDEEKKRWTTLIDQKIDALKAVRATDEGKVMQQKFLFDLEEKRLKVKGIEVITPVTMTNIDDNPKQRAILGLLVGLMISGSLLLLPEVFRR